MYYIVYGLLYAVSLLPLWLLYGIGDLIRVLLFRVFGYRRNVVRGNLAIAFPEKSAAEREKIRSDFEHQFVDTFIETIKLFSAGKGFIMNRVTGNFHVLNELYNGGLVRAQVHMGHNFNWEMLNLAYPYYFRYTLLAVYMPLQNKVMNRVFLKLRSRTGNVMLPATDMRKAMLPHRSSHFLVGLVADQVPGNMDKAWWLNFFGVPTPFVSGPEKGAAAGNLPVIFAHAYRVRRGHYYLYLEVASEAPHDLPKGTLTRQYRDFLERVMRENPGGWLWSHRRWKKKWDSAYTAQWIDNTPPPL
ncbi:lysophospholipid acyltransferase family protein [Flavihumibacter petaseus]|uniref:Putative acyltransferase n=1 Tax=Flavihumibacter petaseus NBRC 106054 TaxID=1220578 RepID=A0A0E9N7F7_9BACT|nr:lipid A biosynthesis acyltransferase [Flavihumibacter petaseus]GAO45285.1 putative acyltransferase [Flavihumibacter petaseus NBRC 106054]